MKSDFFNNYVNANYRKFIGTVIYVFSSTSTLPEYFECKLIDCESCVKTNDVKKRLLLRKPRSINICLNSKNLVKLRHEQYYLVLSKDLITIFNKVMKKYNMPNEISDYINSFIPEYSKLF